MRRSILMIIAALLSGLAVFYAGHRAVELACATQLGGSVDDLEWLRIEFKLNEAELTRVRALHEGYLPVCREWCQKIDAQKQELRAALAETTNAAPLIEQKLRDLGILRAQCQAAMLRHFREVSEVMPPEQGRRYLAEMQRLTLGFHEHLERSMAADKGAQHGHD